MTILHFIDFETPLGEKKRVDLLHPKPRASSNYETTIITGRNGSHKSTLLRQLVTNLLSSKVEGIWQSVATDSQVLCISGSVADRFPQKEISGGARTSFDVPNYAYIGQRVHNNLLSKKAPLETMLSFALAPKNIERYHWRFYSDSHIHAGIKPRVKYVLQATPEKKGQMQRDLLGIIQRKRPETDTDRDAMRIRPHMSYASAQWLLNEFTYDEFIELQNLMSVGSVRKIELIIDENGPHCERVNPNVLRLGLLTELLRLSDVTGYAVESGAQFSLLELSSGEYHMFSTLMAVGFGLEEDAVLLIDEPENNLHPQWQRDLMGSIFEICSRAMTEGHVVVCTHSPLIVGSAREGSTIVDLSSEQSQTRVVRYGASSDELLLSLFGVGSSRNRVVVDTIQAAVSLVERGDFNNPEFKNLIPALQSIRDSLTSNDPMVDVINALIDEDTL